MTMRAWTENINRSIQLIKERVSGLYLMIKPHNQQVFSYEEVTCMFELAEMDFPYSRIAMAFGTTKKAVNAILSKNCKI